MTRLLAIIAIAASALGVAACYPSSANCRAQWVTAAPTSTTPAQIGSMGGECNAVLAVALTHPDATIAEYNADGSLGTYQPAAAALRSTSAK